MEYSTVVRLKKLVGVLSNIASFVLAGYGIFRIMISPDPAGQMRLAIFWTSVIGAVNCARIIAAIMLGTPLEKMDLPASISARDAEKIHVIRKGIAVVSLVFGFGLCVFIAALTKSF